MFGGVCVVFDYDVEFMVDYVFEMVICVVMLWNMVNLVFWKYVLGILFLICFFWIIILFGFNYFVKCINMMFVGVVQNEGEIWGFLIIVFFFGSKFFDDNIFQNKFWLEVSGILVCDLNILEYEWLVVIGWVFYVNLDESKDYNVWFDNWIEWKEIKKCQQYQVSCECFVVFVIFIDIDVFCVCNQYVYFFWYQQ